MSFWEILFPIKCPLCGEILQSKTKTGFCRQCYRRLPYVTEPYCRHCGKPIRDERAEFCYDCGQKDSVLTEGTALYIYTEAMKKAMADFKYGGSQMDGVFYARELLRHCRTKWTRWQIDVLIPVPLHWRRKWFRGYNQSELVAKALGQALYLPVDTDSLRRKRYTRPQKGLDDKKRRQNVQGAFAWKETGGKEEIRGRNVLLIDDIYTTGATLEACGEILKKQGAKNIYFTCLCIGQDD